MKVLVGGFVAESNQHVNHQCYLEDFVIKYNHEITKSLYIDDLAENNQIEVVTTIYADGRGGGIVKQDAFKYISEKILTMVKENYKKVDGLFFFLHGASNIENLEGGSGDHYLLKEIRKIVGKYMPVAIVVDPHGNMTNEFAENCTILRTFRHSPHTDRRECHRIVFNLLVDLLKNRQNINPQFRKVPIMLGGERSVSTDEPMVSINHFLDQIEGDDRIMCCSYHVGYVRHDSDKCGAGISVVPSKEEDTQFAMQCVNDIYDFVYSRHREFKFHGTALELDESMKNCLAFDGSPVYMTDSGDNVTAGASGYDTFVLREFLKLNDFNGKKILFAAITDRNIISTYLYQFNLGDIVDFQVGMDVNQFSAPTRIKGSIIAIGELHHHYGDPSSIGQCYTIRLDGYPIDVVVSEKAVSFSEKAQYDHANISMDYDITVVKQGYLYPELKARAKYYVMALTDGATNQRTERLDYKLIRRPMYPFDKI